MSSDKPKYYRMPDRPSCRTCAFFIMLQCRERSPVLLHDGRTAWPAVAHDHWCGDYHVNPEALTEITPLEVAASKSGGSC